MQALASGTYDVWLQCEGKPLTVTNAPTYADAMTALDSTSAHEVSCSGAPQKVTTFTVGTGDQAFVVRGSTKDDTRLVGAVAGASGTAPSPSGSTTTALPVSPAATSSTTGTSATPTATATT